MRKYNNYWLLLCLGLIVFPYALGTFFDEPYPPKKYMTVEIQSVRYFQMRETVVCMRLYYKEFGANEKYIEWWGPERFLGLMCYNNTFLFEPGHMYEITYLPVRKGQRSFPRFLEASEIIPRLDLG